MTFEHNDVQWGALDSGFCHSDVQFGRSSNIGTLEQYNTSANMAFSTPPNRFTGSDNSEWGRASFKLSVSDTRPNGKFRVTIYVNSCNSNPPSYYDSSGLNVDTHGGTPQWSAGTSTAGIVTGGTYTYMRTLDSVPYQTGYFAITGGWLAWNVDISVVKCEWLWGANSVVTLWEPGIHGSFNHSCVRYGA